MSRVRVVFDAVVDLPAVERTTFLAAIEEDEPAVAAEVRALLECDPGADALFGLVRRAAETMDTLDVGAEVGAYRLQRELGRGGMGTVWLATRADDAYQAQVAIKVLSGTTEPTVRARFEAERQILATLDHPNIARLLDGGTTPSGTPYVVMEHVQGVPIDVYCTEKALAVPERLELFRKVCQAVQYAHAALVVHRDIKPSNILVDERGVPKLLDFGIAKLLKGSLLDAAPDTRTGNHPLTPQYASPEQIRGETSATAADIYSLGVLLNVILTGELPYRLTSNDPMELAHHVCEVEPRRPSVTVLEAQSGGEPGGRGESEARQLSRQLEGDLDNIVLMALRKEPRHRYGSAEELAEDVRRHLQRHPVLARPATLRYRFGRFASRHRWGLATAAGAVLLLVGATTFSFVQMRRAVAAGAVAEQERALAVVQALRATLAAANSRLDGAEPGAAAQLLASVPESARGWEWDLLRGATHTPVTIVELEDDVVAAGLSDEGHSVVTVHGDGGVRVRSAILGEAEWESRLPVDGRVTMASVALGGARIVVTHGPDGRRVTSWDVSVDGPPRQVADTLLDAPIEALTASPDGRRVMAVTAGSSWLLGDDGSAHRWAGGSRPGVAMASGGTVAVQLLDDAVDSYRVLDVRRPGSAPAAGRDVESAVVSADGTTVYTGEMDGDIRVREARSGRVLDRLRGGAGPPGALALSADGRQLASAVPTGDIVVWDVEARSVIAVHRGPGDVEFVAFDGSGSTLAAIGRDGGVWIWDSLRRGPTSLPGVATRYGGEGSVVWIAAESGELQVMDHPTGELFDVREMGVGGVTAIAASPEGNGLAVLADGRATWRDGVFPEQGEAFEVGAPVIALAQAERVWRLVTLGEEGSWVVWDGETRSRVSEGRTDGVPVAVAISPEAGRVATASRDEVAVWDARSGRSVIRLEEQGREPTALAFGHDGRVLAIGWSDNTVGLVDLASGLESVSVLPHGRQPTTVAFSPDGRRLVSGGEDGTLWISDPSTGSPIFELRGHARRITAITFSPDGQRLLTSDAGEVTRLWHADETEVRGKASERLRLRRIGLSESVAKGLASDPDPRDLARRIRSDESLDRRDRIAALQLTLSPPTPPLDFTGAPFDGFAWATSGSDSHVHVGPSESLRMTSHFTVEAWVQPSGLPIGAPDYGVVFNKEGEYQLILSDLGEIWWIVAGPDGWDRPWKMSRYRMVPGVWTHVALVRDGDQVRLVVNGRVVQRVGVPPQMGDHHPAMDDFRIGGRQHTPTSFRGRIDEVRVWSVARSPEEIRAAMTRRVAPDAEGLVAAWSFEEGSGSRAADVTGRHPGVLVEGEWSRTVRGRDGG